MKSLEHIGKSQNLDISKDPEGIYQDTNTKKNPWSDLERLQGMMGQLMDEPDKDTDYLDRRRDEIFKQMEEVGNFSKQSREKSDIESWDDHVEKANFEKYKAIWEKEQSEADKSGVNPETGRYEKGRATIAPDKIELVKQHKELAKKTIPR